MRTRHWTLAAALGVALLATTAFAQGPCMLQGAPFAAARTGMAAGSRGLGATLAGGTHADVAALVGISEAELTAERLSGKTIADVLVEHGITTTEGSARLVAARNARIDVAVSSGSIDAQWADVMKGRTDTVIAALLTRAPGPLAGTAPAAGRAAFGRAAVGRTAVGRTAVGRAAAVGSYGPRGLRGAGAQAWSPRQPGWCQQLGAGYGAGYGAGQGPGWGARQAGQGFGQGYRFGVTQP